MKMPGKWSDAYTRVLLAMAGGHTLKAHRDVEGAKVFRLHALDGTTETIDPAIVEYLTEHNLIDSNKKFPAATYWLTESGKAVVAERKSSRRREA